MPRPPAVAVSERRVEHLVTMLFAEFGRDGETVADVARRSGLSHEAVRRLWRHPDGKDRSGAGFFVVAAIARARGISLDDLAESTGSAQSIRQSL
ncbi:MAG: XRE family transcriptional regulator [Acidimicrobiia bacterium]